MPARIYPAIHNQLPAAVVCQRIKDLPAHFSALRAHVRDRDFYDFTEICDLTAVPDVYWNPYFHERHHICPLVFVKLVLRYGPKFVMAIIKTHYTDISVFGRKEANGALQEFNTDDECISNAMVAFLSLESGEVIYNPGLGGILRRTLHKVMTPDRLKDLKTYFRDALTDYFGDAVDIDTISVAQDKQNPYFYRVEVAYRSKRTNQNIIVRMNTKPPPEPIQQFLNVFYEGQNAELFVEIQLPRFKGQLMTKSDLDGLYYWGPFRFVNLKDTDVKFATINNMIKANL